MPSTGKTDKKHALQICYAVNGRYTGYCTCGWADNHECETTLECAEDWLAHLSK